MAECKHQTKDGAEGLANVPARPADDQPERPSALAAVAGLLDAIVANDVATIVDSYARRDDLLVFVEGPRWQTVGHAAVARGWRAFCQSGPRIAQVTFTDGPYVHPRPVEVEATTETAPDAGATVTSVSGTVALRVRAPGQQPTTMRMRMTWVLMRQPDRWRIVHEHASQPLADPYGSGDWLDPASAG